MPKQYKITMKDVPGAPKSLTPSSLRVTFYPGKPLVTASAAVARYAQRRPTTFAMEIVQEKKDAKPELESPPEETLTGETKDDSEDEEKPGVDPVEAWMTLVAESKNGVPKNDAIKEFADKHKIDLGGATVKDDMIEAIEEALDVE